MKKKCSQCRHSSSIRHDFLGLGKKPRTYIWCNELNAEIEEDDFELDCCHYDAHREIFYGSTKRMNPEPILTFCCGRKD